MKMKIALLPALTALLFAVLVLPPSARAQVAGAPGFIDYQGLAYDGTSGAPLGSTGTAPNFTAAAANYTMQFKIYDQQTGGTLVWAETQTVTVSLGAFSVRLGSGVAVPGLSPAPTQTNLANAFNGKDRYLELTVIIPPAPTGTPITPRLAFQSSPFSMVAQRAVLADSVNGVVTATAGSNFTGTVNATGGTFSGTVNATGATFSNGTFSGNGFGLSSLNANNITSGTLSDSRLSTNIARRAGGNTFNGSQTFNDSIRMGGTASALGINHFAYSNVTMTVQARSGDDYLYYGVNSADVAVFVVRKTGAVEVEGGGGLYIKGPNAKFNMNNGGYSDVACTLQSGSGDVSVLALRSNTGTQAFSFFNSGVAAKIGGTSWAGLSDLRLKENIENVEGSLDKLMKLRSVKFDFKDPKKYGEGRQTGFIAQEVEKVFPEWISETNEGLKMLCLNGFESLTVQALRELRVEKDAQIKTRDEEISNLKRRLSDLEAKDQAREARLARLEEAFGSPGTPEGEIAVSSSSASPPSPAVAAAAPHAKTELPDPASLPKGLGPKP